MQNNSIKFLTILLLMMAGPGIQAAENISLLSQEIAEKGGNEKVKCRSQFQVVRREKEQQKWNDEKILTHVQSLKERWHLVGKNLTADQQLSLIMVAEDLEAQEQQKLLQASQRKRRIMINCEHK